MKRVELSKATKPLRDYAERADQELVVVTARGKPVAAVISLAGIDEESLAVSTDRGFGQLVQRSRERREREGGVSATEVRKLVQSMPSAGGRSQRRKSPSSPKRDSRTAED